MGDPLVEIGQYYSEEEEQHFLPLAERAEWGRRYWYAILCRKSPACGRSLPTV